MLCFDFVDIACLGFFVVIWVIWVGVFCCGDFIIGRVGVDEVWSICLKIGEGSVLCNKKL